MNIMHVTDFTTIPEPFLVIPSYVLDKHLTPDAVVLYARLYNMARQMAHFQKQDGIGVYVLLPIEDAAELLRCKKDKAIKVYRELEDAGLIYRAGQGGAKCKKTYLIKSGLSTSENQATEKPTEYGRKTRPQMDVAVEKTETNNNSNNNNYSKRGRDMFVNGSYNNGTGVCGYSYAEIEAISLRRTKEAITQSLAKERETNDQ